MNFILRLIGTGLGLWVSAKLVPGIVIAQGTTLTETVIMLGLIALVFTIVNSIVRPLVSILAFPLYILTFGLFALVTNGIGFMVASGVAHSLGLPFSVSGIGAAIIGAIITAVVSSLFGGLTGASKKDCSFPLSHITSLGGYQRYRSASASYR